MFLNQEIFRFYSVLVCSLLVCTFLFNLDNRISEFKTKFILFRNPCPSILRTTLRKKNKAAMARCVWGVWGYFKIMFITTLVLLITTCLPFSFYTLNVSVGSLNLYSWPVYTLQVFRQ